MGSLSKLKYIAALAVFAVIVIALPSLQFDPPTPVDGSVTLDDTVIINASIAGGDLAEVIYDWNGSNYSLYDNTLVLMLDFDNIAELGECAVAGEEGCIIDNSLLRNNATIGNSSEVTAPSWTTSGRHRGAFDFDGADDFIHVPFTPSLAPTGALTFSFWAYMPTWRTQAATLVSKTQQGGYEITMNDSSDNDISLWIRRNNGYGLVRHSMLSLSSGWHHFAGTYDGRYSRMYVDGAISGTDDAGGNYPIQYQFTNSFVIGAESEMAVQPEDSLFFEGMIDEVMVWNRSLSAAEIYQQYASDLSRSDSGWNLYVNQSKNSTSGLADGTYAYQVFAYDGTGTQGTTGERIIQVGMTPDTTSPSIAFVSPTPDDGTIQQEQIVQVNTSIQEENLQTLTYAWNQTNYTLYDESLLLQLDLDNVASIGEDMTLAADTSRQGNNGTIAGAPDWTAGRYGSTIDFDGLDDKLTIPDDNSLDLYAGQDMTFAFWLRFDDQYQRFVTKKVIDTAAIGWGFWLGGSSIHPGICDGTSCDYDVQIDVPDFGWHHIAISIDRDGDCVNFLDGQAVNITDCSGWEAKDYSNDNIVLFGPDLDDNDFHFNGAVDKFMIWNRSLTSDDVYLLYASSLSKVNQTHWDLYVNQSRNATDGLIDGNYTYQVFASDASDNQGQSELRTIIVSSGLDMQAPQTEFIQPTPADGEMTTDDHIVINVSVVEAYLDNLTYVWNGTHYPIYDDSLVLMLGMDNISSIGESDAFIADLSNTSNNATGNGFEGDESGPALYGRGIMFDGTDYLTVPDHPSLDFGTGDFTISMWFNISQIPVGGSQQLLSKRVAGTNYELQLDVDGTISAYLEGAGGATLTLESLSVADRLGVWIHLALARKEGQAYLYVDGIAEDSGASPHDVNTNAALQIGRDFDGTADNEYFIGRIDEIRIWDRGLSADEIQMHHSSVLSRQSPSQWYLHINQSRNATAGLAYGNYTFQVFATDAAGNENQTELRTIIVSSSPDSTPPVTAFVSPTPDDSTITSNTTIIINASVSEENLTTLTYGWNLTNYSIYDPSLLMMLNLDRVSSLGEDDDTAVDSSIYAAQGLVNGSAWTSGGKHGGAYVFDGVDDEIEMPALGTYMQEMTITAWIKGSPAGDWAGMIFSRDAVQPGGIGFDDTGELQYTWNDDSEATFGFDSNLVPSQTEYNFVAVSLNASQAVLYLGDGQGLEHAVNVLPHIEQYMDTEFVIGHDRSGITRHFNGTIDEVRIWNRSLSEDEIFMMYSSNLNKVDQSTWSLQINQTRNSTSGLAEGVYTYQIFATDAAGNENQTEERTITISSPADPPNYFISTWDTTQVSDGSSNATQVRLPLTSSGEYDFTVDWGDSTTDHITAWDQDESNHTYASAGTYNISIHGTIIGFVFSGGGDRNKITDIIQWGDLRLGPSSGHLRGASNLRISATDILNLSGTTSLERSFSETGIVDVPNIGQWDTSEITDLRYTFYNSADFNANLSDWDTLKVTAMSYLFDTTSFDYPLDSWDVSEVTTIDAMFSNTPFNQDLTSWNTSKVTDMYGVFINAQSFNGNISGWDVSHVTNMNSIFQGATSFDQDISGWDTSSAAYMGWTFNGASSFDQDISGWDVSDVINMDFLFTSASSFDKNLSSWNISRTESMQNMFFGTSLSKDNYDSILISWASLPSLQSDVLFGAPQTEYCLGESARDILTGTYGWTITDAGRDCVGILNYPLFSGYWDNNGTLIESGQAGFNVTVEDTNGTVLLSIGGTNITASSSGSIYHVELNLTNGTYPYYWIAYGNGSIATQNISETRYYVVLSTEARADLFTAESGVTIRLDLTGNDIGTDIIVGAISQPDHGTVVNNFDGTVNYTSDPGFVGIESFDYSLTASGSKEFEGHYYEYHSQPGVTWQQANASASSMTLNGMQGYLMTVSSAGENDFMMERLSGNSWMGASDEAVEGEWRWVTGPEGLVPGGTQFWQGASDGNPVDDEYSNWGGGEPNNAGEEDHAHFIIETGMWNDLSKLSGVAGYAVEYGGLPGDDPAVHSAEVSVTVSDSIPPGIAMISPSLGSYNMTNDIAVNVSANETVSAWWYSLGGENSSFTPNTTIYDIADGAYTLAIYANDSSGNVGAAVKSFEVLFAATVPKIVIHSPIPQEYTVTNRIPLTVSSDVQISSWWYSIDGGINTSFTPNTSILLPNGDLELAVFGNDSNGRINHSSVMFSVNFTDIDNDGFDDTNDSLIGNESLVNIEGLSSLNITVGQNETNGTFQDLQEIVFYAQADKVMNFSHNFSEAPFDLSLIRIVKAQNSLVVNLSGLASRKTLYLEDHGYIALCVKDAEVGSISEMSAACDGENETDLSSCIDSSATIDGIVCIDEGAMISIGNLSHSAIRGTVPEEEESDLPASTSSRRTSRPSYCGDGTCNKYEDCASCAEDCGECMPAEPPAAEAAEEPVENDAPAQPDVTLDPPPAIEEIPFEEPQQEALSEGSLWWMLLPFPLVILILLVFLKRKKDL